MKQISEMMLSVLFCSTLLIATGYSADAPAAVPTVSPTPLAPASKITFVTNDTKPVNAPIDPSTSTVPAPTPSSGNNETTTNATDTTTTSTTPPTSSSSTTTTSSTTSTTVTPPTTTSTTPPPTTNATTTSTEKPVTPTPLPSSQPTPDTPERAFDGLSFIGGMVLAVGLLAIGVVAFKFYRSREGNPSYFTL